MIKKIIPKTPSKECKLKKKTTRIHTTSMQLKYMLRFILADQFRITCFAKKKKNNIYIFFLM